MNNKSIINSKSFPLVMLLIAVIGAVLYYAARATRIFVDISLGIESFTFGLLYTTVVTAEKKFLNTASYGNL